MFTEFLTLEGTSVKLNSLFQCINDTFENLSIKNKQKTQETTKK